MPLFIVQWKDKLPDGPAIRAATREAHLAWAAAQPLKIKLGGRSSRPTTAWPARC